MNYYAVRPVTDDVKHRTQYTRIEKASSPVEAFGMAFGRGFHGRGYEWKDCGTRVGVLRVDKKRIALIGQDSTGWTPFK